MNDFIDLTDFVNNNMYLSFFGTTYQIGVLYTKMEQWIEKYRESDPTGQLMKLFTIMKLISYRIARNEDIEIFLFDLEDVLRQTLNYQEALIELGRCIAVLEIPDCHRTIKDSVYTEGYLFVKQRLGIEIHHESLEDSFQTLSTKKTYRKLK